MKISRLKFKNIYGITERTITPGDVNIIRGANETGKTSILDAIKTSLSNANIRSQVIRNGESEAELLLELDDGTTVDRKRRSESSDYIKVTRDTETIRSPESYLKTLFSGEQFNPVRDFCEKSPKDQKKILLSLCKIDFTNEDLCKWFGEIPKDFDYNRHILENLEAIQSPSGKYFTSRQTLNREAGFRENVREDILASLPDLYDADEWRNKSLADLYARVENARNTNESISELRRELENLETRKSVAFNSYTQKLNNLKLAADNNLSENEISLHNNLKIVEHDIAINNGSITEARQQIDMLKMKILNLENSNVLIEKSKDELRLESVKKNNQTIENLKVQEEMLYNGYHDYVVVLDESIEKSKETLTSVEEIDVEPLMAQAKEAEHMKNFVTKADEAMRLSIEIADLGKASANLTEKIEVARALPTELLKVANMPVDGITITNGELRVDGLPIDNLSDGRQMEIALEVAKAKAGELKIVLLDGFEKLDPKRQDVFLDKAKKSGLQFFITQVTGDTELTIMEV